MHIPIFKWTSSFLYETIARKKRYTEYLGSKACKTPLNFLTVKLLRHMQILWKH